MHFTCLWPAAAGLAAALGLAFWRRREGPGGSRADRVLAARLAVVAALTFYALGPRTNPGWAPAGEPAGTAIIVLDRSASMEAPAGGVAPAAAARGEAWRLARNLPAGWRANAILAGGAPRCLLAECAAPETLARALIEPGGDEELERGARSELGAALERAAALLAGRPGPQAVFVVSDGQRSAWAAADCAALPAACPLFVLDLAGEGRANLALGRPAAQPACPAAGGETVLSCRVFNLGPEAAEARVGCRLEGAPAVSAACRAPAFGDAAVSFKLPVNQAGWLKAEFWLAADGLPEDDVLRLALEARPRRILALLGGQAAPLAGFAARALPGAEARPLARVQPAPLAEAALAAVAGAGELGQAGLAALAGFAARGGVLLFFLAGEGDARAAAALAELGPGGGAAPWTIPAAAGRRLGAQRLRRGRTGSDLLPGSGEAGGGDELNTLVFDQWWAVGLPAVSPAAILEYDDGTPALASAPAGAGRIILANFAPAALLGQRPESPAARALLARLLAAEAAGAREAAPLYPGEALPGGGRALAPGFIPLPGGRLAAVNLDPRESDLRRLEPGELARRRPGGETRELAPGTDYRALFAGRDLAALGLLAFLAAAAIERRLAGRRRPVREAGA